MNDKFIDNISAHIKKIFMIVFTSGIVMQGLYIYGLWFHEGYISGMGFDTALFSINWNEAALWTYKASRYIGADSLIFFLKNQWVIYAVIPLIVYVIIRLWIALNNLENKRSPNIEPIKLTWLKNKCPNLHKIVKWFLLSEQAIFAFIASYSSMVLFLFVSIFLVIWIFFPEVARTHGVAVANENIERFKTELCKSNSSKWNQCIPITTKYIEEKNIPDNIYGRLIVQKDDLLAIYTSDGPVTMTKPNKIFIKTKVAEAKKSF